MFEFINGENAYFITGGAMAATAGVVSAVSQGLNTNWNNFNEIVKWAFLVCGATTGAFMFGPAILIVMLMCAPFLLFVTLLWSLIKGIKWAFNTTRPQQPNAH